MTRYRSPARPSEEWQHIIQEFDSSGLSPSEFRQLHETNITTAKNNQDAQGVMTLDDQTKVKQLLPTIPMDAIWGIGAKWSERLRKFDNIITAGDLANFSLSKTQRSYSIELVRIIRELNGAKSKIGKMGAQVNIKYSRLEA